MIRSDADYRDAIVRSRKSAERLVNYREELRGQGLSPEEVERAVGFAVNLLDDLNEEIGSYERIKNGDLSGFKTLRDIGELLIAARLACGLGQRELAVRLGIHESQVSRDEKNEYQGISLERAVQVLEVLAIDVEIRPNVRHDGQAGGADDPSASEHTPPFDGWAGRQQGQTASPLT